jgi:MOSC domain-containing protein YiiM
MVDVISVNVATPSLLADHDGQRVYSSIAKQPVPDGTILWLSHRNLAGDAQADLAVHGGADKAVYAYPSEHLEHWTHELDETFGPAPFGENLSTRGVVERDVRLGDVWQWNDSRLQVCQPRWPCFKLALHRRRPDIQTRMRLTGRTGWYLRVLGPGEVVVGSAIDVVARDPVGLTIADAHEAMSDRHLTNPTLVQAVAAHAALAVAWRDPLHERLNRREPEPRPTRPAPRPEPR